jgi:hypothetical protein
MTDIPTLKYPAFCKELVRDVGAKTRAWLALAGQISRIGAAGKAKDAALARLAAFNRGELTPSVAYF